ncbi:Kiwa anti-phage protein KwaB-like domain-containing protein [Anaerosinus gibii]|uniref:DUF4868 domain-containing protein n=1 Tax=Selenobaculum gibii TaxID=3054208 RepID=A0A9Y2AHD1_9FIRM|nr:Kiwa anti-phage protein KwaB-like domain-containing protein [Selenobaculum gbiensis]WIW69877.1 DUF4868 domain-containing protein [Selenobaculum gbiensis]
MGNIFFEKDKLEEVCDFCLKNIEEASNKLVLFKKTKRKRDKYKAFFLSGNEETINDIMKKSIENILISLKDKDVCKFHFLASQTDSLQWIDEEKVINGKEILQDIVAGESPEFVDRKTDFEKIDFIVLDMFFNQGEKEEKVTLFKKYYHPNTAFKRSQKFIFAGNKLEEIKEQILTFDSHVDAFLYKGIYYIINRNSFNSIFGFKDVFIEVIEENSECIKKAGLLEDADSFIEDCKGNGFYLPRLASLVVENKFQQYTQYIKNIPQIIKNRELSISLTKDKKISYTNKRGVKEILDLLLGHYVIDELSNERLLALAVEKNIK